jgi:hypothetical protein
MAKYKLKLNEEKTHTVRFNRNNRRESDVFDFLGFTFYLGLSGQGRTIAKLKSSSKKIRVELKRVMKNVSHNIAEVVGFIETSFDHAVSL